MTTEKPGEFALIEAIKVAFEAMTHNGCEGIGDDCTVIPIGDEESMVVTTDMLVEDVHFLRSAITPYLLGRKSLAVNLSDVAAMGAKPLCSLLALSLPEDMKGGWVDEFIKGYRSISEEFGVPLVGGDTTASKERITISVTAIGRAPSSNIKRRSGAQVGDRIFVTGFLGASALGLDAILDDVKEAGDSESMPPKCGVRRGATGGDQSTEVKYMAELRAAAIMAHNDPKPYIKEGLWLGAEQGVHAMMDLSDGIASDLTHILKASTVGARVELNSIPTNTDIEKALCGGEDYVLLLTIDSELATDVAERYKAEFKEELHEVGLIVGGKPEICWLKGDKPIEAHWRGFTHF